MVPPSLHQKKMSGAATGDLEDYTGKDARK